MATKPAEAQGQAVLDFVQSNKYPESDNIASAKLNSTSLPIIRKGVDKARRETELDYHKNQIRGLSRELTRDLDEWIQRAKKLQGDILQSKALAREVIAQTEEAEKLQLNRNDAVKKANLLRNETTFNSKLEDSIQQIQSASLQFKDAQALAQQGHVEASLHRLQDLELTIEEMTFLRNTNALELLRQRVEDHRGTLMEQTQKLWGTAIRVDNTTHKVTLQREVMGQEHKSNLILEDVTRICASLSLLDSNLLRFARDFQYGILLPFFAANIGSRSGIELSPVVTVMSDTLSVTKTNTASSAAAILDQLTTIIEFLSNRLPTSICHSLSTIIMPGVISRIQSHELLNAVPVSLDLIPEYENLLKRVNSFAAKLESLGWSGTADLKKWTGSAPSVWLSRRKETCIRATRNLLSRKIHEHKTVERVETQMISRGDIIAPTDEDDGDDWGANWQDDRLPSDEPDRPITVEEEDMSRWDDDENQHRNGDSKGQGEEDEWGWGEAETEPHSTDRPSSPSHPRSHVASGAAQTNGNHGKPSAKEMTLRETYRVTGLPDELIKVIQQLVTDADSLGTEAHKTSPIVSATNALYTIPTLVLAAYRALAPTHYECLPGGLMCLYNDSSRLVEHLQHLNDELTSKNAAAAGRLKLLVDIESLNSFARRAYGQAMDAQRTVVRDLIDDAQGFANCTVQPYATACDGAVAGTVAHVRAIAAEWRGILGRGALLSSLGSLLGAIISKVILDIEEMGDIGDEESQRLRRYCDEIGMLSDLFAAHGEDEASDGADAHAKRDTTGLYTNNWIKFQYLIELLDSSLADIRYLWIETGLRLEFDVDELVDLVEALFADNEHRRKAIGELRRE